jgi:hypothetical protein
MRNADRIQLEDRFVPIDDLSDGRRPRGTAARHPRATGTAPQSADVSA